ncbi:hypothetical protein BDV11DRAFT_99250 [Aspergillus similis]
MSSPPILRLVTPVPNLIALDHSLTSLSARNCNVKGHVAQITSRTHWDLTDQPHREASSKTVSSVPSVALPLQALPAGVGLEQLSSFAQVLTPQLSRFAQEQRNRNIPGDETFQMETRRVLHDPEDT